MINANELRLRNYLLFGDEIVEVQSLIIDKGLYNIYFHSIQSVVNATFSIDQFKPIPLTEEILSKVCDYIDSSGCMIDIFHFKRSFGGDGIIFYYDATNSPKSRQVTIKYLHQLQNLYFALKGEELKIEL